MGRGPHSPPPPPFIHGDPSPSPRGLNGSSRSPPSRIKPTDTHGGRGDDVWWPERLQEWYDGWQRLRTPEVMVTVHDGDLRGTQQYYEWFARVARHGRFLSRAGDLADP
ncbi:hypothetical protein PIB30_101773 [Stylosanthes scabra]|uniref:Uncharacterized protein n=1 Tax=Stylosanthes scabra TaxID=79078 RepID=A0ABU6VYT8_9FABA|nr:hypothetical protein [Stylosanthes scabra]